MDKEWPQYGCYIDLDHGCPPDECVLMLGRPEDCIYGKTPSGRPRAHPRSCKYWRQINPPEA